MNIKKKLLTVWALLCISGLTHAQSVQHGQTMLYQGTEQKIPLQNVSINAVDAASVMSDVNGKFTLNFRTLHPGDDIHFRRIELSGYEVMNPEALEAARVPTSTTQDPQNTNTQELSITIVMIRKETLRQLRDGYRSVAAKRYQKQLELSSAQIEELKQQGKLAETEYNERISALEEEYEDKLSKLESYIDKFARIDLTDLDADEQKIIWLVQAGDFEAALKIYEDQHLAERLKQSREDKAKLQSAQAQIAEAARQKAQENLRLRAAIDRQVTLLRMAGDDENLLKAHQILYQTFLADTTNYEARKDYVTSLLDYGTSAERIQLMKSGIDATTDDLARGMMMLELQVIYWMENNTEMAFQTANECKRLLWPLRESHRVVTSRALASWSYYQLLYYLTVENYDSCPKVIEEARAAWAPDTLSQYSLINYKKLISTMSDYYTRMADMDNALKCVQEAMEITEIMARRFPWTSHQQITYADACSVLTFSAQYDNLRVLARKVANLLEEQLNRSKSVAIWSNAAYCYYNVIESLALAEEYALTDSIMQTIDSHNLFGHLKGKTDSTYELYDAICHLYQMRAWCNLGQVTKAESNLEALSQQFAASEDGTELWKGVGPDMLARIALAKGQYTEATEQCKQCIEVYLGAYAETGSAWEADNLCRAYLLQAEIYWAANKKKKTKEILKEASKVAAFECNREAIRRFYKGK